MRGPHFLFRVRTESRKTGVELPGSHSPLFAPVYEPTIRTGVTAATAMALEILK